MGSHMKLEKHVVSLETAQKLNKLGCPWEALFWWYKKDSQWKIGYMDDLKIPISNDTIPAYTSSELSEMLPKRASWEYEDLLLSLRLEIYPLNTKHGWLVNYIYRDRDINYNPYLEEADTLPDALGLMLCYLIENKLIILNDIDS